MSEQECWDALVAFINDAPEEDIQDGWYEPDEVAGGRYRFRIEPSRDELCVTEWDIDTRRERSIVRGSFHPYLMRAKKAATDSSSSMV